MKSPTCFSDMIRGFVNDGSENHGKREGEMIHTPFRAWKSIWPILRYEISRRLGPAQAASGFCWTARVDALTRCGATAAVVAVRATYK